MSVWAEAEELELSSMHRNAAGSAQYHENIPEEQQHFHVGKLQFHLLCSWLCSSTVLYKQW